jgi:hypothetical protein
MLALPSNLDMHLSAAVLAASGAGTVLRTERATPARIHVAVEHLLNTAAFKARASQWAATVNRYDSGQLFSALLAWRSRIVRSSSAMNGVTSKDSSIKLPPASTRRKKQLGLIQPGAATRVDLGLVLKGVEPAGRLEAAGSWNGMMTHRVRLASAAEVDAEVIAWLRQAFDAAG